MWSKVGKYTLYVLLWVAIVGCVIYSAVVSRRGRMNQTVDRTEIIIVDSAMHGNLITTPMVQQWIKNSGVSLLNRPLSELPLCDIEARILQNGFVDKVKIYPTRSGALRVELSQRHAVMRLRMNGYNGYATRDGYIFEAPNYASIYMPIVTGSYRPPFPPSFRGNISDFVDSECKRLDDQIQEVEREKFPLFERDKKNREDMRELRHMRIKRRPFENREAFDEKVEKLKKKKAELRRLYRYRGVVISSQIAKITDKQQRISNQKKKLIKNCEDFTNLINFVSIVERDRFWSSEVVQIIASQGASGSLRVDLSVRSGNFVVIFGEVGCSEANSQEVESVEERLDKLLKFYESGLRRVGWNKYQSINVEYKDQVVCK